MSRYGRIQVAEPPSALLRLHVHDGSTPLREVDHEPKNGVLDQSDLLAQGIRCSTFIPGAQDVDALGSCTANATISALSNLHDEADFVTITKNLAGYEASGAASFADAVGAERAAIGFYHGCTDQTGDPASEWPPTDCGSSGPYIFQYAKRLRLCSTERVAHGAQNIVSLLQRDGILQGTPFFFAWEEPDNSGFVDGKGTTADLEAAIRSGVAGGHETYISAIEKLTLSQTGQVIPGQTVLRVRNSWGRPWGDHGSFRIHLSTLVMLGGNCDFRQLIA